MDVKHELYLKEAVDLVNSGELHSMRTLNSNAPNNGNGITNIKKL